MLTSTIGRIATLAALSASFWPARCERLTGGHAANTRSTDTARAPLAARLDPIRMEVLEASERPPTFVMRGQPRGPGRLVFLHGMCGHGLGYAQSFQFAASKYGTLIAPQADVTCGGVWSKWSMNLDALDARIVRAFVALGHREPIDDILVLGYSQGASRAEALARKWPGRYTRLVIMGGPSAPSACGLGHLKAAVTMAGERDRRDLMRLGAQRFSAAHIPAEFRIIPEATHGAMGPTPERTMGDVLSWIYSQPSAPSE